MTIPAVPSQPEFGAALPPRRSPETLALLASRRSASAQFLAEPGPSPAELDDLLRLAARVPDHGKMTPWRFVVLRGEAKSAFVEEVRAIAAARPDAARAQGALAKLAPPPVCVAVLSVPRHGGKPVWEQQFSAAAACMSLLIAAAAMGYGANWISDWYGEDAGVLKLLGVDPGADPAPRLAGWIMLGTPSEAPLERARADMGAVVSEWSPG